jgi:hypothetical protein
VVHYQSYELNTVLEVEDMCFMVGKSSAEYSLKLHLLRLEMQPLYQDVKICVNRARTMSKLFIHCNYSFQCFIVLVAVAVALPS